MSVIDKSNVSIEINEPNHVVDFLPGDKLFFYMGEKNHTGTAQEVNLKIGITENAEQLIYTGNVVFNRYGPIPIKHVRKTLQEIKDMASIHLEEVEDVDLVSKEE